MPHDVYEHSKLQTLVWIYDLDDHCIRYANPAALTWWIASDLDALNKRNFAQTTSQAVKQVLNTFSAAFNREEVIRDVWEFSPLGESKKAFCQFSGIKIPNPDGQLRMAMLVEATPIDLVYPHLESGAAITLAYFSKDGNLLSANPPFSHHFGHSLKHLREMFNDTADYMRLFKAVSMGNKVSLQMPLKTAQGTCWFDLACVQSIHANGDENLLLTLHDINDLKTKEFELTEQMHTDALTSLLNRAGLVDKLNQAVTQQTPFWLFFVDLDGFKLVNDSFGHEMGDNLLRQVGQRLQALHTENFHLCRFGGDEFVVVAMGLDTAEKAQHHARRLVSLLSKPFVDESGTNMLVSASIGYVEYPRHACDVASLIRFSDAAMYASKQLGKKRYTQFQPGMDKAILRKSVIAQHLPKAISDNEFNLVYQAITDLEAKEVFCFEALLRWSHPDLGVVNPLELVGVAEDIGLIEELENWVIAKAIKDIPVLRENSHPKVAVAINICALHFIKPSLVSFILKQIQQDGIDTSAIILEITESTLLEQGEAAQTATNKLREIGIRLSIDDFGTGYSSLAYLHTIKADIVKIDKAFLSELSRSKKTLNAIKTLIESFDMLPLIEGIETAQARDLCQDIGIHLQQGYYFQMPSELDNTKVNYVFDDA